MSRQRKAPQGATFETVLPRLVCAYEQGRLVPFIGAGLSVPACRLWGPFVAGLEQAAGIEAEGGDDKPDGLVLSANRAISRLRALGTATLAKEVREALFDEKVQTPPQTDALARLWWPIVLSTNYDDCLVTAFEKRQRKAMTVCGRDPDDAQYVLNALNEPAEPILWAIQGYLGGPFGKPTDEFADEIVVGHEEYRKVAHAEPQFRRAFAEVFRGRSMLFLGSGLREPYFREMFSEILEIYGPCAQPHYAFAKKGDLDTQFMATRFQTIVVEYSNHQIVTSWLNALADAVEQRAFRQDRFSFALREARIDVAAAPCSRLTVVRGRLPAPSAGGECLAVSAGGVDSDFFFSLGITTLLREIGAEPPPRKLKDAEFVARFDRFPVYAVRARENDDTRALRVVRRASTELFDVVWRDGFRRVLMQVLASGGTADSRARYDIRPFDALFSFVESVRAFGEWCRKYPERQLELALHVVDPSIYLEITRGRLDLEELLSSHDLRFWAKAVYPDGKIQRQMCQELEDESIGCLSEWLGLDVDHWQVESVPPIGSVKETGPVSLKMIRDEPLSSRVIPGGTLRFTIKS